jgi:WD40 repeat protein
MFFRHMFAAVLTTAGIILSMAGCYDAPATPAPPPNQARGTPPAVWLDPSDATVAAGQTAIFTVAATGKRVRVFEGHTKSVNSVAFSPDGKQALSGSGDKTLVLWDVETDRKIKEFKGHLGGVNSVRFSADGKFKISGSSDTTVLVWRLE